MTRISTTSTAAIQLAPPALASIHDFAAIDAWRRERRLDPEYVRRVRQAFYKRHQGAAAACAALPESDRNDFQSRFDFHALSLQSRHDSSQDGATKLIVRTRQDLLLETVILRVASGRTTLCVSTQVGCAARCDFCATGRMGIARNLTVAEILDQLVQANLLLAEEQRSIRNVVFMGMGEPFHNEEALHAAVEVLTDSRTFALSPSRIMISTVGIPEAMIRAARRWPRIRLALSLHSARPEARRQLMPISERHDLASLRAALVEVAAVQQQPIMIEYLLLAGFNDTNEDLRALTAYLADLPVHVNLIPYNPIDAAPHLAASSAERQAEFSAALKAAGFTVTTRYSLGQDIAAACGQLVRNEHRRRTIA